MRTILSRRTRGLPATLLFDWRPPGAFAAAALAVPLLIDQTGAFDLWQLFYFAIIVPFVAISLLFRTARTRTLTTLSMLIAFSVLSFACWKGDYAIRAHEKWWLGSANYKAQVLAQQPSPNGELQHVDWDGWGFAGSDTDVYLVYDPADSLRAKTRDKTTGHLKGIPCDVWQVGRLQRNWYYVVFYTDTGWTDCGAATSGGSSR